MVSRTAKINNVGIHPSDESGISRRAMLQSFATSATAVMAGTTFGSMAASPMFQPNAPDETSTIPIIDTHQHLWDLKQLRTPWLDDAPDVLKHKFHNEEYAAATAGLPLRQAIYMEIDVHPDDQQKEADLLIAQVKAGNTPTAAAIISGRPNSAAFESYIRPLSQQSLIKGVRQVLHPPMTKRGLCLQDQFVNSMRLLGELNLNFDLCMRPNEIGDAVKVAKLCPDTQFVLDHCGNAQPDAFLPVSKRSKEPSHTADQWKRDIDQLAACPNAACKISGVIASVESGQDAIERLRPVINYCLDAFGPDRVVFGGDWPVCLLGGSFRDWVTTLREIVKDRPLNEQKKLWHENAVRIYRLNG